jgi:hypothetical protein
MRDRSAITAGSFDAAGRAITNGTAKSCPGRTGRHACASHAFCFAAEQIDDLPGYGVGVRERHEDALSLGEQLLGVPKGVEITTYPPRLYASVPETICAGLRYGVRYTSAAPMHSTSSC